MSNRDTNLIKRIVAEAEQLEDKSLAIAALREALMRQYRESKLFNTDEIEQLSHEEFFQFVDATFHMLKG
jgi:hypothetical protein